MKFTATKIAGVFMVDIEPHQDERGFFARTICEQEFVAHGLTSKFVQCSISYNRHKGTLRGMHYQKKPHEEIKLVRCTRGAICDVALDLRPTSPTFRQWLSCELSAANHRALYIPESCAHGFVTLEDDTEILYQISEFFDPSCACGLRWNDPAFSIFWPTMPNYIMSDRDRNYPDFIF